MSNFVNNLNDNSDQRHLRTETALIKSLWYSLKTDLLENSRQVLSSSSRIPLDACPWQNWQASRQPPPAEF